MCNPLTSEEQLRNLGLYSLKKRGLRDTLTALSSFLRRGGAQEGSELFSLRSNDRKHGNSSKVCQGTFLECMLAFFTERVVIH